MAIQYLFDDPQVCANEFIELFRSNWRRQLEVELVSEALAQTINVTARDKGQLIGCLRILSDGYVMSVVCEVIAHPQFGDLGVAEQLLRVATQQYPRSMVFAVHDGNPEFMADLGWLPGYPSYALKKGLPERDE